MIVGKLGGNAYQLGISRLVIAAGTAADFDALRPFDFDRRNGEEQGAGEITGRAKAGFGDGFFGDQIGQRFGQGRR